MGDIGETDLLDLKSGARSWTDERNPEIKKEIKKDRQEPRPQGGRFPPRTL